MRLRLLAAASLVVVALALSGRCPGPAAAPPDPRPAPSSLPSPEPEPAVAEEEPIVPSRDPFRYADEPAPTVSPEVEPRDSDGPPPEPEPPVRLVGFLRSQGGARAAIAIAGLVVLLGPGESAEGWTLVGLDEDGARLRGPDGREEAFTLPE